MDQKTWLWRRKSLEKTILASSEEAQSVSSEKEVDLENSLKILNEKLASVLDECSAKDEVMEDYKRDAEAAAADKRKGEEEVRRMKEELEEAHQQKAAANERLGHLNATLKECMDQLSLVRKEQEQRMNDAVMKTSEEFEKSCKKLEQKLSDTSKRVASLTSENSYLSKALSVKEKLIESLNTAKIQTEAEFEALMARLDSVEKENAFLRYEFRILEKELDVRNEEMEYNRHSAEASNKLYMENVQKIKKLEGECQRLRGAARKRLPAPSALPRYIEGKGRNQMDRSKDVSFLIDQVQDLQKENNIFKEFLAKKEEEIFYLRKKLDHTTAPDELSSTSCCSTDDPNSRALVLIPDKEDDKFKASKTIKNQMIGASEMRLMDDFVEMEKLAIVAVDSPIGASCESHMTKDWLQIVTNMILEQHTLSRRSIDELLEDIRMSSSSIVEAGSKPPHISGYITWKSPVSSPKPNLTQESSNEFMQPDMNKSIAKLMELIATFDSSSAEDDYEIHAFRWRKSDLTTALQEFIDSCSKLLDGKINFDKFSVDLTYILGWIITSCTSFQDPSAVREEFKKHLGGEGPGTALQLESVQNLMLEMEKMHSVSQAEIKGLRNELSLIKSSDQVSGVSLPSGRQNNEALMHKLLQSQQNIASLEKEMGILKESKRVTEDQLENIRALNEDTDTQLSVTRAKLNEVLQKLSSAEVELDDKSHCCQELEGTCLELQLQLESIANNQYSENQDNQGELQQTGMEITKASAKLAECEETILKLGKQLKALGSAKEQKLKQRPSLRDQMIQEDNGEINGEEESPKTKEIISTSSYNAVSFPDGQVAAAPTYVGSKSETRNMKSGALVIVPSKKRGGIGFLRKLLLRRKKASSNNTTIYFGK